MRKPPPVNPVGPAVGVRPPATARLAAAVVVGLLVSMLAALGGLLWAASQPGAPGAVEREFAVAVGTAGGELRLRHYREAHWLPLWPGAHYEIAHRPNAAAPWQPLWQHWEESPEAVPPAPVVRVGERVAYAFAFDVLVVTSDAGATWHRWHAGAEPALPPDLQGAVIEAVVFRPTGEGTVTVVREGYPAIRRRDFRTCDGGRTWQLVPLRPSVAR